MDKILILSEALKIDYSFPALFHYVLDEIIFESFI